MRESPCETYAWINSQTQRCDCCGWPRAAHTHEFRVRPDEGPFSPDLLERVPIRVPAMGAEAAYAATFGHCLNCGRALNARSHYEACDCCRLCDHRIAACSPEEGTQR